MKMTYLLKDVTRPLDGVLDLVRVLLERAQRDRFLYLLCLVHVRIRDVGDDRLHVGLRACEKAIIHIMGVNLLIDLEWGLTF